MADDTSPDEPMLDIARGNAVVSRQLHRSLRALRDNSHDPTFRRIVDEVLAGRISLRAAFSDPRFTGGLEPGITQFKQTYDALDPHERARLADEGAQLLGDPRPPEQPGTT
jgi:hypothetical protein